MKFRPPSAAVRAQSITLPAPRLDGPTSVEQALLRRRSTRRFLSIPLKMDEVSQLVWAAQGITDPALGFRTAPSAGALYPLELYVAAGRVDGLPAGLYHYAPPRHVLIRVLDGDLRRALARAALDQLIIVEAPAVLILGAVYERTSVRYGARSRRYVEMEAGHAAQNIYLESVPLKLGTVVIGAFDDEEVRRILGLAANEQPLYLVPVGKM